MLLLQAKFLQFSLNRGKIAKPKLIELSVCQFFAKPFVKRILCFCFFGTKKSLTNFFGQKREVRLTLKYTKVSCFI